jgi:acyl-CoA thioesterase-1
MKCSIFETARFVFGPLVIAASLISGPAMAQGGAPHDKFGSTDCPASHMPPLALPMVKQALATNSEITIVALGSSSTQGWHSTDIAHSYPAILQEELSAALPMAHVAVINRGVGGQDAPEMVPRLQADALAVRPSLVIWQLGANGAMKKQDPAVFRELVAAGIGTMQAAKADVVLMDNQRAPFVLAAPDRAQFDQALSDAAARTGVGLFSRGALMDQWQAEGHPYDQFISTDGVHHNNRGYRCMAKALAGSILDGLGLPPVTAHSALARR